MKRRRFLQIVAGAVLAGGAAQASTWQGRAFGADLQITASGDLPLEAIKAEIAAIEATFSLYAESELTRLNARGVVPGSARLREVLAVARRVHDRTRGAFDPTVQPLWRALAEGGNERMARAAIGFHRVRVGHEIRLARGQALTLNGIAQGHAADAIARLCEDAGLGPCLIDMGELRALGGPFRIGLEDPTAGQIAQRSLSSGAVATSSPGAIWLAGGSHILGPHGQVPRWSTVSVEGATATLCDAASTAFVLMERHDILPAARRLGLRTVMLVDFDGNLERLTL
ncbi:thiamine biosynthesis lipoprotein [Rhodobacter aestuarii]|uniref:FAD:protein FMN transferase n=1 Tax=Rhodobacter aestuarii TaxID=453582 RepID=A0A1N7IWJ0_9RHOB|nr:FAD:protein FMN transferase [Rhodobacter aestuarii]PTV97461.1 thiamine biosynthesis lipoprotein [Rhodobacter aestuarii]SIS41414.1 thiamine biosynthesis lipoprotein [Rhodobacter aestuarii]